ncbi:MAG: hypothetical protein WB992_22150 [Bryobacteraceae bacterium]
MIHIRRLVISASYILLMLSGSSLAQAASVFNFDSDAVGRTTTFTDTAGGLSATFGGEASVCDVTGLFVTLTGNALIQDYCVGGQSGPLPISFSANLSKISFDFATAGGPSAATLTAFENGKLVGTAVFTSSTDPNGIGEGFADFSGLFNSLSFSSPTLLAIDNVSATTASAVPEPGPFAMVGLAIGLIAYSVRVNRSRKSRP